MTENKKEITIPPDIYMALLKRAIGHVLETPNRCGACPTYNKETGMCDNTAMPFPTPAGGFCGMFGDDPNWITFAEPTLQAHLRELGGKS